MSTACSMALRNLIDAGADVLDVACHAAAGVEQQARGAAAARGRDRRLREPLSEVVIDCGLPSSTISKSSAVKPGDGAPCLSVTTTLKWTRSTPVRNVCCARDGCRDARRMRRQRLHAWLVLHVATDSEHLVARDADDVRARRAVGVDRPGRRSPTRPRPACRTAPALRARRRAREVG